MASLHLKDQIGTGCFADVFRPFGSDRVFKLLRRHAADQAGRAIHSLFESEKLAYTIAAENEALRPHIATLYGLPHIDSIFDSHGRNVSDRYHLDCCLEIEYLDGVAEKLIEVPDEYHPAVESLFNVFYDAGIRAVGDASVIRPTNSGPIKVIDWSMGI